MQLDWMDRCDRNLSKMQRVEARLGVAPTPTNTLEQIGSRAHAARRCAFCTEGEACDTWLEAGAAGDAWFDFCPNAGYYLRERGTP